MTAYHGSGTEFNKFAKSPFSARKKLRLGSASHSTISDLGFFFTPSPEEAEIYAHFRGGNRGIVSKWELDIKNPYYMSYEEFDELINWGSMPNQKYKSKGAATKAAKKRREELVAQGYDGIFIMDSATKIGEIVIFSSEQATKVS